MLTFQCGVCQTQLQAPEAQAGKLVRCPKCQTTLRVPGDDVPVAAVATTMTTRASAPATAPGAAPASPSPPAMGASRPMGGKRYGFNCQYCSSRLETVESLAGQEGSCPTCGNAIIIPILDRFGRLIDPMTGKVIKQDPHPVHAYAAAGERAPRIVRTEKGAQAIVCPKCRAQSPVAANNCKSCGMPFTMEGTTAEAAGASNGYSVASLVLGIIGIPTCVTAIIPLLGLIFGVIGYLQTSRDGGTGGRGIAIAGLACSAIGLCLSFAYYTGLLR